MSVRTNLPKAQPLSLEAMVEDIQTREDFVAFAQTLQASAADDPSGWENKDLPAYIGAMAAWTGDMEGYFANRRETVPDQPSWKLLGQILLAGRVYE